MLIAFLKEYLLLQNMVQQHHHLHIKLGLNQSNIFLYSSIKIMKIFEKGNWFLLDYFQSIFARLHLQNLIKSSLKIWNLQKILMNPKDNFQIKLIKVWVFYHKNLFQLLHFIVHRSKANIFLHLDIITDLYLLRKLKKFQTFPLLVI